MLLSYGLESLVIDFWSRLASEIWFKKPVSEKVVVPPVTEGLVDLGSD